MKPLITDILQVDYALAKFSPEEWEVRYKYEIVPVEKNHFCQDEDSELKHYKLILYVEERCLEEIEDEEEAELVEWHRPTSNLYQGDTGFTVESWLQFYWSGLTPSIEKFSNHIHKECRAAYLAIPQRKGMLSYDEIEPTYVLKFLEELGLGPVYKSTSVFVAHYDFWDYRLYATQKWLHYLVGNLQTRQKYDRFDYPVGQKLIDWLVS